MLGRELFTPDEVRKLDNKKCIIFIRGFDPIMDNKFIPFNHPMFNQTADGKGKPYVHQIRGTNNLIGPPFEILSDKAVKYYEKLKDKGENVYIDSLTYEQFMMLGDAELSRRFSMQDEAEQKAKIDREQANELEYVDESQKSEATESANASSGSAGAKPVRNPEREKPKWEDSPITMLVMMESIQNRIVENGKRGKATWLYIDEFHVLLNSEYSAKYLQQLWKKVRKQGGLCTGITQNVVDLLQNYTATTMLANSEFVALLKQANTDSSKMAEVIGVSEAQLRFVTNTASGMGLIKCGSVVIPFDNQISKDTDLYRLYNTNIHEKIAEQKKKEAMLQ